MKYHITIKNNATGEVLVDKDTEVCFVAGTAAGRIFHGLVAEGTMEALRMVLRAAKWLQKTGADLIEEMKPFEEANKVLDAVIGVGLSACGEQGIRRTNGSRS